MQKATFLTHQQNIKYLIPLNWKGVNHKEIINTPNGKPKQKEPITRTQSNHKTAFCCISSTTTVPRKPITCLGFSWGLRVTYDFLSHNLLLQVKKRNIFRAIFVLHVCQSYLLIHVIVRLFLKRFCCLIFSHKQSREKVALYLACTISKQIEFKIIFCDVSEIMEFHKQLAECQAILRWLSNSFGF